MMDVKPGFWSNSDQTSMETTPRDCSGAQVAHPQHQNNHQLTNRASFAQNSGWQHYANNGFEHRNEVPTDFDLFGHSMISPTMLPRQSIESGSNLLPQNGNTLSPDNNNLNHSPAFTYPEMTQNHTQFWSGPKSTPVYPPPIPEDCQWSIPQSFNEPMSLHGYPLTDVDSNAQNLALQHSVYFSATQPFRKDSPFVNTDMDTSWDMTDAGPVATETTSDEMTEGETPDPCYAQLLYRCLKEAQGNTMSLRELYEWVSQHSQKAKDPKSRGWQNSVRHNLSMNAAFERVTPGGIPGAKKGSLWRLTDSAMRDGVISTTRYRKDPKRKSDRRVPPAVKRQISGAKGGQATRNATRRQQALDHARSYRNLQGNPYQHCLIRRQHDTTLMSSSPFDSLQGSQPPTFMPNRQPASPYFVNYDERSSMPPSSHPDQSFPQFFQGMYELPVKPSSVFSDFPRGAADYLNCGLVGNIPNDFIPDTPSLATEASFITDESHSLMSPSMSREATSFQ